VNPTFNEQFDKYSAWRREFASRLRSLADWLREQDLWKPPSRSGCSIWSRKPAPSR